MKFTKKNKSLSVQLAGMARRKKMENLPVEKKELPSKIEAKVIDK
jgi:hypothetical protein